MADRFDEARLRDTHKIEQIRQKWNLNKKDDLEEVVSLMQAGSIRFETEVGRAFDDELFERKQQMGQGRSYKGTSDKHKSKVASGRQRKGKMPENKNLELQAKLEKQRKLIIYICIGVAALSLGYFSYYCYQAYRSGQEFQALSELKDADFSLYRPAHVTVDAQGDAPDILEEYQMLYNKNKSLIGWLKIDDTIIDYPVMQSSNEEYYLNHNFDQKKDNNGSLFIDAECSIWPRSQNLIIYGHNMKSGKMFGSLNKYKSEDYFKKHPTIQFDTLYEKGEYQIIFVFSEVVHEAAEVTFKYYQFINANSEEEYASNIEEMKKMSLYDTGITANYGDELITLSTCDYSEGAERFAVVAKRVN